MNRKALILGVVMVVAGCAAGPPMEGMKRAPSGQVNMMASMEEQIRVTLIALGEKCGSVIEMGDIEKGNNLVTMKIDCDEGRYSLTATEDSKWYRVTPTVEPIRIGVRRVLHQIITGNGHSCSSINAIIEISRDNIYRVECSNGVYKITKSIEKGYSVQEWK